MKILIRNVNLPGEYGYDGTVCVAVDRCKIVYVGVAPPSDDFDRVIDGKGNLLIPGFFNTHCHAAMTLFRGYGEDLPLDKWLHEKIFPAEDRLNERAVRAGTMLAIAEMLAVGTVSFSDMYMFEDIVAQTVLETGIKANLSRSIVSFDENEKPTTSSRFLEGIHLVRDFHEADDGRILVDMSLHAEYTNTERMSRAVADYARENHLRVQVHISETEEEQNACKQRRNGRTPIAFFADCGLLDSPVNAAHCVWVSEEDMEIMHEKGVYAIHNPVSNLKLASGIMPMGRMLSHGVHVALGTDGAASNNNLDLFREMKTAAILHKGAERNATVTNAHGIFEMATLGGALAQGREDCGRIEVGKRADLVLVDTDTVHNIPSYGGETTLVYSADASDVRMTMVDGKVLYENGEYQTIDVEKLKYEAKDVIKHYFD